MHGRDIAKQKVDLITLENSLAEAMFMEVVINKEIKTMLHEIAATLLSVVLQPIANACKQADSLLELPQQFRELIIILANRYFVAEKPFGTKLDFSTVEEITSSIHNIKKLLEMIEETLSNALNISNCDDAHIFMSTMAYLNWFYFDYLKFLHHREFANIKNMLWPTPEESDVRVARVDLGEEPKLAISYGIGTDAKKDLALEKYGVGVVAGKSLWAELNMEKRIELLTEQFDAFLITKREYKTAISKIENQLKEKKSLSPMEYEKLSMELNERKICFNEFKQKKYTPLLQKMQYYKIPLSKKARQPLALYAKSAKTTFEKLITVEKDKSLPTIASVSGSTARALVTYTDISCFTNYDGSFNLDKAQIIANCLTAFYIRAGHHSFVETAEVYNRLLDFIAIEHPEQLPMGVFSALPSSLPYIDSDDIVEKKLPYYVIGDYQSYFHDSYAEVVWRKANEIILNHSEKVTRPYFLSP